MTVLQAAISVLACMMMNASCTSVTLDAFIVFAPSPSQGNRSGKLKPEVAEEVDFRAPAVTLGLFRLNQAEISILATARINFG